MTSTGSGVGGGAAFSLSFTSTRPLWPATTSSVLVQVSWPASATSSRRLPAASFSSLIGVWPTAMPSTLTTAPDGVETTSAEPVVGTARGFSVTRSSAAGESARSSTLRASAPKPACSTRTS